jgi:hypothetical protein
MKPTDIEARVETARQNSLGIDAKRAAEAVALSVKLQLEDAERELVDREKLALGRRAELEAFAGVLRAELGIEAPKDDPTHVDALGKVAR